MPSMILIKQIQACYLALHVVIVTSNRYKY
jgi:hypothetical protein